MDLEFICRAIQVSNVVYVNETWGNFKLHEESKTLTDSASGQSKLRREKVIEKYLSGLPLIRQLGVKFERMIYTRLPYSVYIVRNRDEILPKLNQKIGKRLK